MLGCARCSEPVELCFGGCWSRLIVLVFQYVSVFFAFDGVHFKPSSHLLIIMDSFLCSEKVAPNVNVILNGVPLFRGYANYEKQINVSDTALTITVPFFAMLELGLTQYALHYNTPDCVDGSRLVQF